MSYDSVEVLAHFAARKGITVPLLSDPRSEIIRRFGVVNDEIPESDARQYGMPHPGTFVIDERGFIRDKFFEAKGYHPLALTIKPPQSSTVYPAQLPGAEIRAFSALGESVPVYTRPVRIMADIALGSRQEMAEALSAGSVTIRGRVTVQACDEAECYAPQEIPVTWELVLEPVDTERVPEGLRRETRGGVRPS